MKNSQLPNALSILHAAGKSALILGKPGIGKTEGVRAFAEAKGMTLISVHAPLLDLLDVKGVISTANDKAEFLPLKMWPAETDKPVVVLIDEFVQAVPAIQNALSQLLIDHQMGDIKLPKGSMVIATGNRKEDKANTHNVPSHVKNRVATLHLDVSVDDFITWGVRNDVEPSIMAFLRFRPDLMHTFDPKTNNESYGSPRSWKYASDIIKAVAEFRDNSLTHDLVSGVVGVSEAGEYLAYQRMYAEIEDPKWVLANPSKAKISKDASVMYAMMTAVAMLVDDDTVENFFTLLDRYPTEFAVAAIKTAAARWPKIKETKAIDKYIIANMDLMHTD